MAAKAFEKNLIKQATESAWQSYGRFVSKFDAAANSIHNDNLRFLNLSCDLPFSSPPLADHASEQTEFGELLQTCGNMELNKVIRVFAELCSELNHLSNVGLDEFVDAISLYGDGKSETDMEAVNRGDDLTEMSKFLNVLYDLLCFANRAFDVIKNIMQQLEALFNVLRKSKTSPNKSALDVDGIRFDLVFECLGRLAVTLVNIDEVLAGQSVLKRDFVNYKRMVELVSKDVTKFEFASTDGQKVKSLLGVIVAIERDIIDGESFLKRFITSITYSSADHSLAKNQQVADQFATFIKVSVSEFESNPSKAKDDQEWLAINLLFIGYVWLFRKEDKKLFKSILDCEKRTGLLLIHLRGNVTIFADRVLAANLPKSMADKKSMDQLAQLREQLMKNTILDREVKAINYKLTNWMVTFESIVKIDQDSTSNLVGNLLKQMKSMEEGLELAANCGFVIKNFIYLHLHFGKAITKNDLSLICKLINVLKAIELSFDRKKSSILLIMSTFAQYNSVIALNSLSLMKKRLIADVKKYNEKKLDTFSAVILASNCFHGPILTQSRQIVTSLCLAMILQFMNDSETIKIVPSFNKIEECSKLLDRIKSSTNCDFIFFNRRVFGIYFNYVHESDLGNVRELRYFFHGLADCVKLIRRGLDGHDQVRALELAKKFEDDVFSSFKKEYLDKLCSDFETELRLQTHLELKLDDQSPFKRRLRDFARPLNCEPIRMFNKLLSIKNFVENYLNEMSYNLTTIALHDWKTYESMLNLARTKYGLDFVTSQLPTQTLEQGLDVLEITRNIHIFVSKYLYNLNNQMFIEKSSENKHLNVLLIRHVANSIQTHGFGVINTAVNFTYQFLRKKFYIFSQFLFEDHIKSRLIKDLRYFRETKSNCFSFERADKLVKGIRKLGLNSDGLSYLDQFRILISEIGNALGFVRMLRSGALHCSSNSVAFVPDLDDLAEQSASSGDTFESMAIAEGCSGESLVAAKNLDTVLKNLNRNFSEATDYFKLLVDVFAEVLAPKASSSGELKDMDTKNYHLRNFYVILPALSINFVENSIIAKEKMTRKNKIGAQFTDDGFAMGVAYVLRLLNQYNEFDALQWFSNSVKEKLIVDRNEAIKQRNALNSTNADEKLTQTTSLTLKRLEVLQTEFELLNYNLTSCRILFKGNAID